MGAKCSTLTDSASDEEVETDEFSVRNTTDGYDILCKLWTPCNVGGEKARAVVLFIHGGIFCRNDRNSHSGITLALVKKCGLAVLTADFRDGSSTTFSSGKTLTDLISLANHLQNIHDPTMPFGVIGSSSGGFLALQLCNALPKGQVQFCIPLAPVADPLARAMYLQHCIDSDGPAAPSFNSNSNSNISNVYSVRHTAKQAQSILMQQLKYFESFTHMSKATEQVATNKHSIPTLLVLGAVDKNVPSQVTKKVQQDWATRTILLANVGHELQNEPPASRLHNFIPDIDLFLAAVLNEPDDDDAAPTVYTID